MEMMNSSVICKDLSDLVKKIDRFEEKGKADEPCQHQEYRQHKFVLR